MMQRNPDTPGRTPILCEPPDTCKWSPGPSTSEALSEFAVRLLQRKGMIPRHLTLGHQDNLLALCSNCLWHRIPNVLVPTMVGMSGTSAVTINNVQLWEEPTLKLSMKMSNTISSFWMPNGQWPTHIQVSKPGAVSSQSYIQSYSGCWRSRTSGHQHQYNYRGGVQETRSEQTDGVDSSVFKATAPGSGGPWGRNWGWWGTRPTGRRETRRRGAMTLKKESCGGWERGTTDSAITTACTWSWDRPIKTGIGVGGRNRGRRACWSIGPDRSLVAHLPLLYWMHHSAVSCNAPVLFRLSWFLNFLSSQVSVLMSGGRLRRIVAKGKDSNFIR